MTLAKRIIAIVIMVVSVIGLVASLGAIVEIWTTEARFAARAQAALDGIAQDLQAAAGPLDEIGPLVGSSRGFLEDISATAGGAETTLGEPKAVELAQTVRGKLSDIERKVQDANGRLGEVETRINGLLATINRVPGVQVPPLDVRVLDDFGSLLSDVNAGVQELADAIAGGKASAAEDMKAIDRAVTSIQGELTAVEASAARARGGISAAQARLANWRSLMPRWMQQAATLLTVALIWFAAGQIGLFMWMWSIYRSAASDC